MELRTLVYKNRDAILSIANKHGARNIRVFGSVIRGEADEESDIDLLVLAGINRASVYEVKGLPA